MKNRKEIIIWILFSLLIIFQCLDIWQTYIILESGIGYEMNPLLKYCFDNFGYWKSIIIIKGLTMLFLGVVIKLYIRTERKIKNDYKKSS